ncbi:hypothetical protein EYC80_005319 [Monilinia laxa]|uniref:Uncharacterized protein n=1 Tax=Monilinia laxa TaxID=61186 RepID=A0A5N6KK43_MONLA|nr:hypothetical protein EYC80_005319 [Monilinia laxa]
MTICGDSSSIQSLNHRLYHYLHLNICMYVRKSHLGHNPKPCIKASKSKCHANKTIVWTKFPSVQFPSTLHKHAVDDKKQPPYAQSKTSPCPCVERV